MGRVEGKDIERGGSREGNESYAPVYHSGAHRRRVRRGRPHCPCSTPFPTYLFAAAAAITLPPPTASYIRSRAGRSMHERSRE